MQTPLKALKLKANHLKGIWFEKAYEHPHPQLPSIKHSVKEMRRGATLSSHKTTEH